MLIILDRRNILSEVTKSAFSIMAVALIILSAGSLLVAENRLVDNSAICGQMPLNGRYNITDNRSFSELL